MATLQARNICALAKYGNKGTVTKFPTKKSAGYTNWSVRGQVHWYGNCYEGNSQAHCCTGAAPFKSGQDWLKFASGMNRGGSRNLGRVIACLADCAACLLSATLFSPSCMFLLCLSRTAQVPSDPLSPTCACRQ